ncbi:gliding motility lipoprotein GldB [Mesonia aestuariivivens]|uniref:Gliding motility lipoprotein GldB n=1 Tax=Mesonia aestuariivivens TaxID=2796128 RepID=A0ABS6W446_9FLAO|nr:gliding motility lipoprotein GldB [Mesonia aestuariivivens]MBW2962646.1 gliding motility lipoprotein GldB [Mesonia aestuariivivens]
MLKNIIYLLLIINFITSCKNDSEKIEEEIAKIPVNVAVDRFDKVFAEATPEDIPKLKREYPLLFPKQYADSVWVKMINDTIQQELNRETLKAFPEFEQQEALENLFQHLKYYFPQFQVPKVITVTSEVDYRHQTIVTDTVVLVSLDTYLGEEHKFYIGLQSYLKKKLRKEQIIPDIATAYAKKFTPQPEGRTFLASMIYYGKLLYVKDQLIPNFSEAQRMGYTSKEITWAHTNEEQIWRYFIEHELLYDTDNELEQRFINLAPFSKFRLQLDNESPSQLGQYMGWQIVKQFAAKNPEVSLAEVLQLDAETIFKQSNYKPRKP